jgi:DNA processing protein
MIVDARARAWVSLNLAAVAAAPLAVLLRAFGAPQAVVAATPAQRHRFVAKADVEALDRGVDAARLQSALDWLALDGHSIVAWDDGDYPPALLEIAAPPPMLYCLGRRDLLREPAFAIVGSRNGTPQGCADAQAFAGALASAGLVIVSGLALGIDAAAHRGGLSQGGRSIAIIGTGPDRVYPARNRALAHALADSGLLLSEFPPGTPALKMNFPRRNRVISGLSRGVLVVEATLSSGSLITARLAAEQGRDVFALPGSIHSPFSKGCHRLIRDGAKLVETAQDVLDELRLPAGAPNEAAATAAPLDEPVARAVLTALGHSPADGDTIAERSGLAASSVLATLTALELAGRVATLPGGRYQRVE